MKKRILALLLAALCVLGLAACAEQDAEPSAASAEPTGEQITVRIYLADAELLCEKAISYTDGMTAYDALSTVCTDEGYEYTAEGEGESVYVTGIEDLNAGDDGDWSGWTYKVNGEMPTVGCGAYSLAAGDLVSFMYTRDFADIEDLQ